MNNLEIINNSSDDIKNKIYTIRGLQVMLDRDLAELYEVETRALNQAVKRNKNKFPNDFMFQLMKEEVNEISRSQFVILKQGQNIKYLPYAFTEQGVAGLSGVLKSAIADQVHVKIMRAFVAMRRYMPLTSHRLDGLENTVKQNQLENDKKFKLIFDAIEEKNIKPSQGIFFNGQIFDAYVFVADLIKSAKKSIILIDNYVDESVLLLLTKRAKECTATIYTKQVSDKLKLDLAKHNKQYPEIKIKKFSDSHDRFLIIDRKEIYHLGASLKDLGKKWFAFSKMEVDVFDLLKKLS